MYREIYMYVNAEWMVYTPILYHFPIHAYCSAIPIWSKWWFITHSWCFHLNWTGLFHSCEFCLSLAPALSLSHLHADLCFLFENTLKFIFERKPMSISHFHLLLCTLHIHTFEHVHRRKDKHNEVFVESSAIGSQNYACSMW